MLYIRKRKKKYIQQPMSQNRKKKFDSHRTDQRYHTTRKGLGLGLLFSLVGTRERTTSYCRDRDMQMSHSLTRSRRFRN